MSGRSRTMVGSTWSRLTLSGSSNEWTALSVSPLPFLFSTLSLILSRTATCSGYYENVASILANDSTILPNPPSLTIQPPSWLCNPPIHEAQLLSAVSPYCLHRSPQASADLHGLKAQPVPPLLHRRTSVGVSSIRSSGTCTRSAEIFYAVEQLPISALQHLPSRFYQVE
ncbi:hypothetical protein M0R45_017090 [Rubus argutus]|uniref:Uncharacterized protein n=1 Tax=Rubus argutus TaxID=59490 RepID=A0AAW1XV69_RUBAR